MHTLNTILGYLFGAIMFPFRDWPLVGLVLISVVVSVGILLIFKKVSNQDRIDAVKRQIQAALFEIRLFNDDLGAIFRAQGSILRNNLTYLGLSLVPLAWMIIPFILLTAQLQFHYGYRGLRPGEGALVKVQLAEDWRDAVPAGVEASERPPMSLEIPAGIELM